MSIRDEYKKIAKSDLYHGVTKVESIVRGDRMSASGRTQEIKWKGKVVHKHNHYICFLDTEREAALWVDKKLIELGLPPKNILKKS